MKHMTCREFDDVVHGFVRMELLDVTLREEALDHAARCGNCTERMAQAGVLAEATETMGKSLQEHGTPDHVEVAVMAAFRKHHRRAAWRRTFEWAAMGVAAALVLFFVWTGAGSSRGQSTPLPRKDVSSQAQQPLDARAPVLAQPGEIDPSAEIDDTDLVTGEDVEAENFVPLPSTYDVDPDDPGIIVRVQMTRASLAQLGYLVVDSSGDDSVLADVLVGEDGWPRAVKVIQ